ncbi:duodenase-1-like [Archocentrus centrarchus]|uniref:duodenase-1-like n=1 Tax=Archocentrus centrarchus TaxID=63155 RepID=UPI0011E9C211|nr:duodenase-1-like [Archocentrus centrarchus]
MDALQTFLLILALTCLGQNALGSEIIKGKKAKKKSLQYMASVQDNIGHICGGFLVSEDFVMTAAHCDAWNPTSVVLGTHNLKKVDKTMRYGIKKKCKHPSYKNISSGNDIMLLKLCDKAYLNKKRPIKPIQLPTQQINLQENKSCSVAGWGAIKSCGKTVDNLQVVDVPIINLNKCRNIWQNIISTNVICAGGYYKNKGFCQGDSGGPLVCDNKMAVGVASFNNGNNCDYPDFPNVYTDISKFLPWIKDILNKKNC